MTFDPDYATNGRFYVSCARAGDGQWGMGISYIARYTVSVDPNFANRAAEVRIISAGQPESDHDYDWIGFSNRPDNEGNFYLCSGAGRGLEQNASNHLKAQTPWLKNPAHPHRRGLILPSDNPFFGAPAPTLPTVFLLSELTLRKSFRQSRPGRWQL